MPTVADPWLECTLRPLAVVNALLAELGSADRAAVFSPGANYGLVVLLPLAVPEAR